MPEITLWNTMTRRKDRLTPVEPGRVSMYVCGPTVYDRAHIGNARPVVVFDVLYRLLRHVHGTENVRYVRNFTDVDDKINARAAATGRAIREITDETIGWYHADMDALGALRPTAEPRATEFIGPMVAMIETLIARGHAYAAEGHVLFSVTSFPDYGRLARRSLEDMRAGARVEVAPYKRDPMDFVLWKPSTPDLPGWDSPWGRGRPGWHIECSAMAYELLGAAFDIHGGGIDLAFPHHENEVAQSCCAHPEGGFASIWMHNGFVNVEGEKMSKSLGNFFTVRDLLDKGIPGEVIRFVLLSSHYRQPMDFTEEKIAEATRTLRKWREAAESAGSPVFLSETLEALEDDLNTPLAIATVHKAAAQRNADGVLGGLRLLGLPWTAAAEISLGVNSQHFVASDLAVVTPELGKPTIEQDIDRLVLARLGARKSRDFSRADALRDALVKAGVELQDEPGGTRWSLGPKFDPSHLEGVS